MGRSIQRGRHLPRAIAGAIVVIVVGAGLVSGSAFASSAKLDGRSVAAGIDQQSILDAHNAVRSSVATAETQRLQLNVSIPALTWSAAAAQNAQTWADSQLASVAAGGDLNHNPNLGGLGLGENAYAETGFGAPDIGRAVDSWASEASDYNYDANTCAVGKECGHYTQLVWANTTGVGCGVATDGNTTVVFCDYAPAGNVGGEQPYVGTPFTGPPNDNFANAAVLNSSGGTATATTTGATKELGEPITAGDDGGASVWWRFTPSASAVVTVDTCTSNFDTLLGVYTGGSVAALSVVASSDDSVVCGSTSTQSRVTFNAVSGRQYSIVVDGFGGATGTAVLHVALSGGSAPGAPTITSISSGSAWVEVSFNPPGSSGSSAITGYRVTLSPSGQFVDVPAGATRAVVEPPNGTTQTATVFARNAVGTGPGSTPSGAFTPSALSVDVTTTYNAQDNTRLVANATYFGDTAINAQRTSVGIIAFIVGLVGAPAMTPVPPPASSGPNSYTTPWSTVEQSALVSVMRQYGLSPQEAQYFSVELIGFLLALGGH